MPRLCSICQHQQRAKITMLRHGGATFEALASEFRTTASALSRHFANQKCSARWQSVECSHEPAQAHHLPEAVELRRVVGGPAMAFPAPVIRQRETVTPADPSREPLVTPVSLFQTAPRSGKVVTFPRGAIPDNTERKPQELTLQNLSRHQELGHTDDQIAEQYGLSPEDMPTRNEALMEAKRAVLGRSPNDWAATLICSCMARLARYRRRMEAAEIGLRHREVDRLEDKIAATEIHLAKLIKDTGIFNRLDFSELARDENGIADMHVAVENILKGVFVEPVPPGMRVKPFLR